MVIYDLICDSRHEFEGWFKNSEDLVTQRDSSLLSCPICDSLAVTKKVAAPKVARKSNSTNVSRSQLSNMPEAVANLNAGSSEAYGQLQKMLTSVHKFIDSNFEDVGNRFANEALSMHRGEREVSSIRGTASADQIKDLADQGVAAMPLPAKPVDKKKLN